jgi:hypothetical protein
VSREKRKSEAQSTESPVEVRHEARPTKPLGYTVREVSWDEFEKFTPTPRKERPKTQLREAFEMAAYKNKTVKIEGLKPGQVRAALAAISRWSLRTNARVKVKYDVRAGVIYLAPAERPTEEKQ